MAIFLREDFKRKTGTTLSFSGFLGEVVKLVTISPAVKV